MNPADLPLCIDLDWNRIQYPCIVEPKIDGFRCLVTVDEDGTVHAWSRSGTEWPKVAAALSELSRWPGEWFDGELVIGGTWATTNAAMKRGWKFDANDLVFVVFDGSFDVIMNWRAYAIDSEVNAIVCRVYKTFADCREAVESWYRKFVKAGYEGIVVKTLGESYTPGRSGYWQKLKPNPTQDVFRDGRWLELNGSGTVVRERADK